MYQAYNWMNIDIMDLKLTWSYLWSVILKYSSWALIDKVLQFVFEFDRSIDEILNFDFLIFFWFFDRVTLWSKLVSFPFSIIFPKSTPTNRQNSNLEFERIPTSFNPIFHRLKSKICLSIKNCDFWDWETIISPPYNI